MFIYCECCVSSGRGLCDELITRPEESYGLWCVVLCDLETSRMQRPWSAFGRNATGKTPHGAVSLFVIRLINYIFYGHTHYFYYKYCSLILLTISLYVRTVNHNTNTTRHI
jgi:hypothetical protein